jgi:hypothetical protein
MGTLKTHLSRSPIRQIQRSFGRARASATESAILYHRTPDFCPLTMAQEDSRYEPYCCQEKCHALAAVADLRPDRQKWSGYPRLADAEIRTDGRHQPVLPGAHRNVALPATV